MAEDCFFFIYSEEGMSEEDEEIRTMCIECRTKSYPNVGWFWRGSIDGYGPWEYKCHHCDKIIYSHENDIENDLENEYENDLENEYENDLENEKTPEK